MSTTYKEASVGIDSESFSRLGKFYVVAMAVGTVVVIILFLSFFFFMLTGMSIGSQSSNSVKGLFGGTLMSIAIWFLVAIIACLVGQMYALSWYEKWRGCQQKN